MLGGEELLIPFNPLQPWLKWSSRSGSALPGSALPWMLSSFCAFCLQAERESDKDQHEQVQSAHHDCSPRLCRCNPYTDDQI